MEPRAHLVQRERPARVARTLDLVDPADDDRAQAAGVDDLPCDALHIRGRDGLHRRGPRQQPVERAPAHRLGRVSRGRSACAIQRRLPRSQRDPALRLRLAVFKLLYYIFNAGNLKRSLAAWKERRRALREAAAA